MTVDLQKLFQLRFKSHRGGYILPHHSMRRIKFTQEILLSIILVPLFVNLVYLFSLDHILQFWHWQFDFWIRTFRLSGEVAWMSGDILGIEKKQIPYPFVDVMYPEARHLWISGALAIAISVASLYLPERHTPITYIIWFVCFILLTTVLFYIVDDHFSFDIRTHLVGQISLSLSFLWIAPWVLGATYNIFNFSIAKKLALALMVLGYFVLLFPMQYMFYAYAISQFSLVLIPVLYFVFIIILDVTLFMAFYAWALSWQDEGRNLRVSLREDFKLMERDFFTPLKAELKK